MQAFPIRKYMRSLRDDVQAESVPSRELVILVGMQGSGKTYYCRTVLGSHVRISQDEGPRSLAGVLARLEELLAERVPLIVIDRTNPIRSQRQSFIQLARQAGYRVRIVHFDLPRAVCEERIQHRCGHPTLDAASMAMAINRYLSCLEIPTELECDELVIVRR